MERWGRAAAALRRMQKVIAGANGHLRDVTQLGADHAIQAFENADRASIELFDNQDASIVHGVEPGTAGPGWPNGPAAAGSAKSRRVLLASSGADVRAGGAAGEARSKFAVPFPVGGRLSGVLTIASSKEAAFDDRDVAIAELLTAPIAYGVATAAASETQRAFEATFEQAAVGIAHVAPDGRFVRVNARFSAITGYSTERLMAGGFQQITHPEDLDTDLRNVEALREGEIDSYAMEKRYIRPDGGIVWVNLTVSLVRDLKAAPDFFVAVIEDISARKEAEALAMFDPLTGLPNRRQVMAMLRQLLDDRTGQDAGLCVTFIDLDRFKIVNDRLGHAEGDRCLVAVAELLQREVRASDMVGRLAGDEFVLLMRPCSRDDVAAVLERVQAALRGLSDTHDWRIGISAGVLIVPAGVRASGAAVLAAADAAMYHAKNGSSSVAFTAWTDVARAD